MNIIFVLLMVIERGNPLNASNNRALPRVNVFFLLFLLFSLFYLEMEIYMICFRSLENAYDRTNC